MEKQYLEESDARELLGSIMIDLEKHRNYMIDKGFKSMDIRLDDAGKTNFFAIENLHNPDGSLITKVHSLDDRYGDQRFLYTAEFE